MENYWTGRKHSEETRQKMSAAKLGKKRPDSVKKKISEYFLRNPNPNSYKKGHKHPEHVLQMLSSRFSGSNNPNWKGGVYPINESIRRSKPYYLWRDAVYARDNFTCQICGARSSKDNRVRLNADHIKPFALFPELRFELSNGRTLCVACHKNTETFAGKMRKFPTADAFSKIVA